MRRIMLAALTLAATAAGAAAGPIDWTYKVTVSSPGNVPYFDLGRHYFWGRDEERNDVRTDVVAWMGIPLGSYSGRVTADTPFRGPFEFVFTGNQPPSLGAEYPAEGVAKSYTVQFEVTDTASGESAAADFAGSAYLLSAMPMGTNNEAYQSVNLPDALTWTLGANRYDFRFATGNGADYLDAVTVTPLDSAETPEPATISLAILGLAAAGALRLRR